ncbi:metalloreductase STEAP4 [Octopus bimaculoides]|uniref:Ferric oxidoreductase domain-containing protein n=1 Tax=Octopus bimaculoides TaxID=37653 RepID=A0A0L8HE16_OCTBM|nr:metalloreductase STEAP4 [Octopus bimaculoides]|eukprot:XP_014773529.1 PREDICTED: metalloreductase STEAP4-like [Octopus bimaculoides]
MVSLLTPYKDLLGGKVLVDVSNRSRKPSGGQPSNAEVLAEQFPNAHIVKGLNTLAPDVLEGLSSDATSRTTVYLAGNDINAVNKVGRVIRHMGFSPICRGDLTTAHDIEALPHMFMKGWAVPACITCCVVLLWFSLLVFNEVRKQRASPRQVYHWQKIPLNLLNVLLALSAISLLALTYFPGCLAALVQLCYGTKYKRFPPWMDEWLKSRKVLGLTAILFAFWHVVISLILVSPSTMPFLYSTQASSSSSSSGSSSRGSDSSSYHSNINDNNVHSSSQYYPHYTYSNYYATVNINNSNNSDSSNNNKKNNTNNNNINHYKNDNSNNNTYYNENGNNRHHHQQKPQSLTLTSSVGLSVGILSFITLSVVGIVTLPSVGSRLNWREWRFFQSHLGYATLFLAAAHVTLLFVPYWQALGMNFYAEKSFLCCLTPFFVLFLKLLLILPPIHRRIDAIRGGWVRKKNPPKVTLEEMELL